VKFFDGIFYNFEHTLEVKKKYFLHFSRPYTLVTTSAPTFFPSLYLNQFSRKVLASTPLHASNLFSPSLSRPSCLSEKSGHLERVPKFSLKGNNSKVNSCCNQHKPPSINWTHDFKHIEEKASSF